jgi:hypothetical protein
VIAYSNKFDSAKSLVIYHNAWGNVEGNLHFTSKVNNQSISLTDALDLKESMETDYVLYREHISGLEHIRSIQDLSRKGLDISLGAYDYRVYLDFTIVKDTFGLYRKLENVLQGKGVKNIQSKLLEIKYENLISHLMELSYLLSDLMYQTDVDSSMDINLSDNSLFTKLSQVIPILSSPHNEASAYENMSEYLSPFLGIFKYFDLFYLGYIFSLLISMNIRQIPSNDKNDLINLLSSKFGSEYPALDIDLDKHIHIIIELLDNMTELSPKAISYTDFWFSNHKTRSFLNINEYETVTWFNQESLERLINITMICQLFHLLTTSRSDQPVSNIHFENLVALRIKLHSLIKQANFQVESYRSLVKQIQ